VQTIWRQVGQDNLLREVTGGARWAETWSSADYEE